LLKPLTVEASINLISNLLSISKLPEEIAALLEEKVAGVPYFIEEVVRDLQESGVLMPSNDGRMWQMTQDIEGIHVPDNLEAVLVSRMDRLEPETRHTLQLAAVIGRSFQYRVLKLVTKKNGQLDKQLRELQHAGMIRETARIPEQQYMFRHVFTQEAAYNTILFSDRRLYHLLVGEAMENIFSGQLEEQATLLAIHFDKASEELRALPYHKLAGERAHRLFANAQAMIHYKRAIEIASSYLPADQLPENSQQELLTVGEILAQLHESAGDLLMRLGDYPAAHDHYTLSLAL
jgi:predicted ATPase